MKSFRLHRHQRGFGIIDVALTVVLAGLLLIGVWTLHRATQRQTVQVQGDNLLVRADQALIGYTFQNGVLPCPAPDTQGMAAPTCSPQAEGWLPYQTIGLPDAAAGLLHYTIHAYPKRGSGTGVPLTVNANAELKVLWGQSPTHPSVVLSNVGQVNGHPSAGLALCALLTAPVTPGQTIGSAYTLQANEPDEALRGASGAAVSRSPESLDRTFADLSRELSCPEQLAASARTPFNTLLSAQILLAGMTDYLAILQNIQNSTTIDLVNDALPTVVTGPAKVGAKVMNLNMEQGNCVADPTQCGGVAYAIVDLITESIYAFANAVKAVRFAVKEVYAAVDNAMLANQIIGVLAVEVGQLQQHAVNAVGSDLYL
ncbi:hypothetical protein WT83_04910 [Burkholderia territorii]|uniref:Uncharacterized protein n=1 Tax=Burkholderia territorii TaxID=1503055 RepID=A0A108F2W3_9BURK|nr:hypothetical protein [Burkholderia territorii]KWN22014.1 hypothetical protein WT83_04910 [Burkholderia territorii]